MSTTDAEFIAHTRQDIPWLLQRSDQDAETIDGLHKHRDLVTGALADKLAETESALAAARQEVATFAQERALLHGIIEDCNALIDPEAHPTLNARINEVLLPCDDAGTCVPPPDLAAARLRATSKEPEGATRSAESMDVPASVSTRPPAVDERGDYVCEHGTAMDVHCCACRRRGFFPPDNCDCYGGE